MTQNSASSGSVNTAEKSTLALLVPNATVFASSFCVMVIELVAGRMIAGTPASSIYTWTSVIGIVLAGLATGNYVGGRLADRFEVRRTLAALFIASSAAALSISVANNLVEGFSFLCELEVENDALVIRVDDDGPGIPEEKREHVFAPFARLDGSRNRSTGGYGLGLAIVRECAWEYGGGIQIGESPSGGARFTLHLPNEMKARSTTARAGRLANRPHSPAAITTG